jgi:hypothetical protein
MNLSKIIIKEYDKHVIGLVKELTRMRSSINQLKYVYKIIK